MVRRPKIVWSGLDKMDMHRKPIAGDGNCLFASLADQLYEKPDRHLEIRAAIIAHMRTYRPLFDSFLSKDDIQQKRATRATTHALKNNTSDDPFEEYLAIMCKPGTYGGEPELQAFVQCYDRDVMVHFPGIELNVYPYINHHRQQEVQTKPALHICYGGDEVTRAHYDSARKNDRTSEENLSSDSGLSKTASTMQPALSDADSTTKSPSSRAIRGSKLDISRDLMHDMIVKGSKDLRSSFDGTDRARSPSVTSSHQSSGSKRSFDDDGEQPRVTKRADRRKSTRHRSPLDLSSLPQNVNRSLKLRAHSRRGTPQSTQNSDDSSDQSERGTDTDFKLSQESDSGPESSQDVSVEASSTRISPPPARRKASSETMRRCNILEGQRTALQA